jgi:hypothetical protein
MTDEPRYIIEYITIGNAMKVTAMDPATLREVSVMATPGAPREEVAELAIRKLKYMINKKD